MLAPADQRDLLAPLYSGALEAPPWQEFLRRLRQRTAAAAAAVLLGGPAGAQLDCRSASLIPAESARIDYRLHGRALRPLRVYALAELPELLSRESLGDFRSELAQAGVAFGRVMRVPGSGGFEAWLVLEHDRADFTAADSALVSDLGPHLSAALDVLRQFDGLRQRAAIAEDALAALGVSQALLDTNGRVLAGDAGRLGGLAVQPGDTVRPGTIAKALRAALPRPGQPGRAVALADPESQGRDLLVRPAPPSGAALPPPEAALALGRSERRGGSDEMAGVLAALYGLSAREAALAVALSEGAPLVPAGIRLGLTAETARVYSKRIYAKTATRGQADLVRLVLTGLAPFARPPL